MKGLNVKISLDEETRKQGVLIGHEVYSLHITDAGEVVVTDNEDYRKILSVQSVDFFKMLNDLERGEDY